jgi:hypothetical protein
MKQNWNNDSSTRIAPEKDVREHFESSLKVFSDYHAKKGQIWKKRYELDWCYIYAELSNFRNIMNHDCIISYLNRKFETCNKSEILFNTAFLGFWTIFLPFDIIP